MALSFLHSRAHLFAAKENAMTNGWTICPAAFRQFIKQKQITLKELAETSGVSLRTIKSKWNSKEESEPIQQAVLTKLAKALGLQMAQLTERVGPTSILEDLSRQSDHDLMRRIVRASISGHGELAQFIMQFGVNRSSRFPEGACDEKLRVVDHANRELNAKGYGQVHKRGLWHRTVILFLSQKPHTLVIQRRHPDVDFRGLLDVFGGHEIPEDQSPLETALREANSEMRQTISGIPLAWSPSQFRRLGDEYSFTIQQTMPGRNTTNREFSTVYLMRAPIVNCTFHFQEDGQSGYAVETPAVDIMEKKLDHLLHLYETQPNQFADGLGRVLAQVAQSPPLKSELRKWLCW